MEGTIDSGWEKNNPVRVTYMDTPQETYYLVDYTDEASRKQKADSEYCPTEGTLDCYLRKRVKVYGVSTPNRKWIKPYHEDHLIYAKELDVFSFEALK